MKKEKIEMPAELRQAQEEKLCKKDWEFFRDVQLDWDKNSGKIMTEVFLDELMSQFLVGLKTNGYYNIKKSLIDSGDKTVVINKILFSSPNSKRDEYITVIFDYNLGKTLLIPPGVFSV